MVESIESGAIGSFIAFDVYGESVRSFDCVEEWH
jgi:hypothetical protein